MSLLSPHPSFLQLAHPFSLNLSVLTELSAPHHEEEARLEMRETTSLLLAVDLEHREGGHGEAGTRAR